MKKVVVKTSENIEFSNAGNDMALLLPEEILVESGNSHLHIEGFMKLFNGSKVNVIWNLNQGLLDSGVSLRGVFETETGWTIYLHNSGAKLKLKPKFKFLLGSVYEAIALFPVKSDMTTSGARIF